MGVTVREKPKGSGVWWVFVAHEKARKSKRIGKDKRIALEVAEKIKAKIALKEFHIEEEEPDPVLTFGEYAKIWITTTIPATCKPSTERDYRGILDNHVLPKFGHLPITEITRGDVKKFLLKKINDKFSASTVTHIKNALGGVFNLALDDEVIQVNPAHRLGKIIRSKPQINIDPLTKEELSLLLNIFQLHFPNHYPMALTLARTGIRSGEAIGLKWCDIDFNSRFITIQRNISRGKIQTTKNDKIRRVDMSEQLAEVLLNLKHYRKEDTLKKGWGEVPEWVFLSTAGTYLNKDNWRNRIFHKALEKAGLRRIRVHDIRHSYASILIQNGESLAYIKDQLGHHSIKVTVDIYGHLAPEGNKKAVNKLDDPVLKITQKRPIAD